MRHARLHLNILFILPLLTLSADCFAAGLGVTSADQISTLEGFEVDLVYEVPSETQGSWVSLTVDPKGRLVACDQYGGLYRIDVSGPQAKVERLTIDFEGAQGLLCAFGSLYANVNSRGQEGESPSGLWRLTDTDGDDQYDKKEHLIPLNGGSEHGPHGLILTPDGKRIIMCAGNNTDLPTDIAHSRVPRNWDEDHLLGRMPDARGHNASRLGPGGFILSFDPDGKQIELIATGFRNEYDIALNRQGELFAYDADMEWDVGTPWYRPTRINHVISGAEFGWRNGTGKWPAYYPDSFGSAVNIGPGSPTGICFGYGANFPKKYQDALFICDWSYGNIHAVHLTPDGSSYTGTYETFATAAPFPVTDLVVHPTEGSMYVTIGGRRTQSGLYRIRYTGKPADDVSEAVDRKAKRLRSVRRKIEATHAGDPTPDNISLAVDHLGHADRAIRFAARISLEHQPVESWRGKVAGLKNSRARIQGVIALARNGDESDKAAALAALTSLKWGKLSPSERIDLLRAYGLIGIRLGKIETAEAGPILDQIGGNFPTGRNQVDRELAQMLVYLDAADAVGKIVAEMKAAPSQENQIHYAMTLRGAGRGWNQELHRQYFQWFSDIRSARGGMSFGGFIENIKKAALERVPEDVQQELDAVINPPKIEDKQVNEARPLVKEWTVDDVIVAVTDADHVPDFEQGKQVFAAGQCYKCHRMGIQGGILGPVLTSAGGRFSPKDLLVSIIEPEKEISDQYGATQFLTDDGQVVIGRVVNMNGNKLQVMTNMLDPSQLTTVERDSVELTRPARTSMMPAGLLNTFTKEEIADLIAYLRAGGQKGHPIYNKSVARN
jgi:putative heme-binding domain-containing protein